MSDKVPSPGPLSQVDALDERDGAFATVSSVVSSLLTCRDTESLMHSLARIIVERTRADGAYVSLVNETDEYLEIVVGNGQRVDTLVGSKRRPGDGITGLCWERNEAVYVKDAASQGSNDPWPKHTQAWCAPLHADGVMVGALSVVSTPNESDLSPDLPLLQRIASIASLAFANTLMIDETRKALERTRSLSEISRLLSCIDDRHDAYDAVCRQLLGAVDANRVSFYLLDENGELASEAAWSQRDGVKFRPSRFTAEEMRGNLAQWVVQNAEEATTFRHERDPRLSAAMHARRDQLELGSTYAIPLMSADQVAGVVVISRQLSRKDFDDAERRTLQVVARQLAMAMEQHRLAGELHHQAYHDRLTGLPNRSWFEQTITQALSDAKTSGQSLAVLFIDLDGFKYINDTLGHAAGDCLLIEVARQFKGCLEDGDMLARMGGDEFAVLSWRGDEAEVGQATARRMLKAVSRPFDTGYGPIAVGASIGISCYPHSSETLDGLLRSADIAMYQAKQGGKGSIRRFDDALAQSSLYRSRLEADLRDAINRQELYLAYQPQVSCSDRKVVGVEALLRWHHPELGLISPDDFIPIAEETGLINHIGTWVIEEAVRQLAAWQAGPIADLRVCINIAAPQFQLDGFCDQVLDAIERHDAPIEQIELEVTESVVMNDVSKVVERLEQLRAAGVRIAVDDFGTGYSSLRYLQDLPLDVLKIDRAFVNRLDGESDENSLVNTILHIARGLGLETIAEGVESEVQRDALTALHCDTIQGFFYSKPVSASEVAATVAAIEASDLDKAA